VRASTWAAGEEGTVPAWPDICESDPGETEGLTINSEFPVYEEERDYSHLRWPRRLRLSPRSEV
jgi:hypothetical protein